MGAVHNALDATRLIAPMSTSNDQAADRILKTIDAKKLLSAENFKTLSAKFATGRMTASEWTVLVKSELLAPKTNAGPKA